MALRRHPFLCAALAAFVPLVLAATSAAKADQVGFLECNVSPGTGLIITSSRALSCRFNRSYAPPEYYVGTITSFGVSIGTTGPGRLAWGVFAATPEMGRFALAGTYGGASANITIGAGLGANALIGGNANSIGLQPLSINSQTGIDITAGVTGLVLEPAGPPPRRYYRHY